MLNDTVNDAVGAKILVVEDSAAMRARIVWELAELTGIQEILQAEDLASALVLLNAHHPAVAILDLHLRTELAFPILQTIQQQGLPTVSVIYSNATGNPLRDACLRLGAHSFLPKGGGFGDVAQTVSAILSSLSSARPEPHAAPESFNP